MTVRSPGVSKQEIKDLCQMWTNVKEQRQLSETMRTTNAIKQIIKFIKLVKTLLVNGFSAFNLILSPFGLKDKFNTLKSLPIVF